MSRGFEGILFFCLQPQFLLFFPTNPSNSILHIKNKEARMTLMKHVKITHHKSETPPLEWAQAQGKINECEK